MNPIVTVEGLRKTYGATVAVDEVSFEVHDGEIFGMVVMYPMLFLSGAFFTVELLPATVQKVLAFLPLTYVVDLLRGLWIGEAWGLYATDAVVLAAMLVVGVLVSVKLFRWE